MGIPLRRILKAFYSTRPASGNSKRAKVAASFSWARFIFILAVVLVTIKFALLFLYYNTFISLQYDVEEAAAQIDAQLQRRRNIILNLSIMVTDYARHEREIFTHAADTRREMAAPKHGAPPKKVPGRGQGGEEQPPEAAFDFEAMLSKIFAIAERYPDLRLSENFQRYMDALVDAETKIAEQRMIYNEHANDMSTAVGKFPGFIFAKLYGFKPPVFFEPEAEARKPPRVVY